MIYRTLNYLPNTKSKGLSINILLHLSIPINELKSYFKMHPQKKNTKLLLLLILPLLLLRFQGISQEILNEIKIPEIDTINSSGNYYLLSDPDSSLKCADLAFEMSWKRKYYRGVSYALNTKGRNYTNTGGYDTAFYFFNQCVTIDSIRHDYQGLIVNYCDIGILYDYSGNYPQSIKYYYKALEMARKSKDTWYECQILYNIASAYKYTGDSLKAKDCYFEGLSITSKLDMPSEVISVYYNNIAELYVRYPGLMAGSSENLVLTYTEKAKSLLPGSQHAYRIASIDLTLTQYYILIEDFNKAEYYAKAALKTYIDLQFPYQEIKTRNYLAKVYLQERQFTHALNQVELVIKLARENENNRELMNALELKTTLLLENKDFEFAVENIRIVDVLKDSLLGLETKADIAEIEQKYSVSQEKSKVLGLQNEIFTKESYERILNFWITIVIILLILSIVIAAITLRLRKTKRNLEVSSLKISLMSVQMNPHFTFNILNSIQNLILLQKNDQASLYLAEFASFLRKTLEYTNEQLITFEQEMSFIKLYLELEKLRFKERISYELEIDESIDLQSFNVPPLFLQPFVENSFVHGFNGVNKGIISISIKDTEADHIEIKVTDNGIGLKESKKKERPNHKSMGVALSKKRISNLNQRNGVTITDNINATGVTVSIQLYSD
mgnify:CR=1 FL=1